MTNTNKQFNFNVPWTWTDATWEDVAEAGDFWGESEVNGVPVNVFWACRPDGTQFWAVDASNNVGAEAFVSPEFWDNPWG